MARSAEETRRAQQYRQNRWRKANPEKLALQKAGWFQRNRAKIRARRAKSPYRWKRNPVPRPDRCEICGTVGTPHFDHCHSTGNFRGWLCNPCNGAIAFTKDDPAILRALADYVERGGNHPDSQAPAANYDAVTAQGHPNRFVDPENRAKHSAITRAAMAQPEARARYLEGLKTRAANRKVALSPNR
jgi:hypothetical protein